MYRQNWTKRPHTPRHIWSAMVRKLRVLILLLVTQLEAVNHVCDIDSPTPVQFKMLHGAKPLLHWGIDAFTLAVWQRGNTPNFCSIADTAIYMNGSMGSLCSIYLILWVYELVYLFKEDIIVYLHFNFLLWYHFICLLLSLSIYYLHYSQCVLFC